jgi:hypothetical protein
MSERKALIVNLLSVPLTKDKQSLLLSQFQLYAALVNYTIKLLIQRQIILQSKALETMRDSFEKKFFALATSSDSSETTSLANARVLFESKFDSRTIEEYREASASMQGEQDTGHVDWFVHQYFKDVVRTALSEIARHRRMAATVRSPRDKSPFFKPGRMVLSAPTVSIGETSCVVLAVHGEEIPVPFDKRSRGRETAILTALAAGQKRFSKVRLKWHKEGYVDINIRVENPTVR